MQIKFGTTTIDIPQDAEIQIILHTKLTRSALPKQITKTSSGSC
jgi:hypothetical protein